MALKKNKIKKKDKKSESVHVEKWCRSNLLVSPVPRQASRGRRVTTRTRGEEEALRDAELKNEVVRFRFSLSSRLLVVLVRARPPTDAAGLENRLVP